MGLSNLIGARSSSLILLAERHVGELGLYCGEGKKREKGSGRVGSMQIITRYSCAVLPDHAPEGL